MCGYVFKLAAVLWFTSQLLMVTGENCNTDRDCYRPDTYCYVSGECVKCLNCAFYQRQNGTKCAHDRNNCGDCLPGMQAEINIDGSLSVCTPTQGMPTSTSEIPNLTKPTSGISKFKWTGTLEILVIVIFILVCCGLFYVMCKDHSDRSCTWIPNLNVRLTSPPPYTEKRPPTAPPFEDSPQDRSNVPETTATLTYHVEDERQNASPFKAPDYMRRGQVNPTQNDPPGIYATEETDNQPLINNVPQIEEETVPSSWVPDNAGEQPPRQNFANILTDRTNRLTISQPDVTREEPTHQNFTSDPGQPNRNSQPRNEQSEQNHSAGNLQQINIINSFQIVLNRERRYSDGQTGCQDNNTGENNTASFTSCAMNNSI